MGLQQGLLGRNSPKSTEISQTHKETNTNTQNLRSVYFILFLVILPKFGTHKPFYDTPLLELPVGIRNRRA